MEDEDEDNEEGRAGRREAATEEKNIFFDTTRSIPEASDGILRPRSEVGEYLKIHLADSSCR